MIDEKIKYEMYVYQWSMDIQSNWMTCYQSMKGANMQQVSHRVISVLFLNNDMLLCVHAFSLYKGLFLCCKSKYNFTWE